MSLLLTNLKNNCIANTTSYKDLEEYSEQGDFDVFFSLKGWLPEKLPIHEDENSKLWSYLKSLNLKLYSGGSNSPGKLNAPSSRENRSGSLMVSSPANLRSSSFRFDPFMIVFAYRDAAESSENISNDLKNLLGYPFRIIDYKDNAGENMIQVDDPEEAVSQRFIKIRSYFSCGYAYSL